MSPHAIPFRPDPVRPVGYRAPRSRWLRRAAIAALVALVPVLGTVAVIAWLQANQAARDAAYYAGMVAGQTTCGRR